MEKNRFKQILENMSNYYLISAGIKKLISTDDENPIKIGARLLKQYNNCENDDDTESFNNLLEVFTDRTFLHFFEYALDHSDVSESLTENDYEELYFKFIQLTEERADEELAYDLLTLLGEADDTESIDNFFINICGYSITTILDYMENKNNELVVAIERF